MAKDKILLLSKLELKEENQAMKKCNLVLDNAENTIRASMLEDKNWNIGEKIVHEDTVYLVLDFEIVDNIKIYRVKIK